MSIYPNQIGFLGCVTSSVVVILATVSPAAAGDTLYFIYTPFRFSLRLESLEQFAEDGTVNQDLAFYMNLAGANEENKNSFQKTLDTTVDIDPLLLSRFLNTDIGEDVLQRVGYIVNIQGGRNGKYPLRGAIVTAALSEEGLSLSNFLRNLPVNMEIDVRKAIQLARSFKTIVEATTFFREETTSLSEQEAMNTPKINYEELKDLRQAGTINIEKQRWILTDTKRSRTFYVDVYNPESAKTLKTHVVIISHGLASRPEDFVKDAKHLASYGYLVLIPQHIGSDYQQLQALITAHSRAVFLTEEFIDRPLDISYVIDELERRNQSEFNNNLELTKVGVFGHSFGGYTALALAGATIDFEHLERECELGRRRGNISLLLQCRALQLPRQDYNFRDERVAAVYVSNPVNNAIFGPQGLGKISIPVFIGAGNYDLATPFIFEQVLSFPWFTTPDKYLFLQEGQTHVDFSQLDAGMTDLFESAINVTLPTPQLLQDYFNTTTLAFFKVHVNQDSEYTPYLQSSYLAYLSQNEEFKAHLITSASSKALSEAIVQFKAERNISLE